MTTVPVSPPIPSRLGVPDLFRQGRFEQVLIATFGADLEFYERVLRKHFGNFRNQIVLADHGQLEQSVAAIAEAGVLRHLNRSWLAGPVTVPSFRSAHAKFILLAGPEAGLLLVGSGNLNLSGYAGAGECFTPYRWDPETDYSLAAFTTIRAFTDGLAARGHVDGVTGGRLDVFWSAYDWWHQPPTPEGPVRHNLDRPLGLQLVDAVGSEPVEELLVATPFHDPACAALNRLVTALAPGRWEVLVQPGRCSVDPGELAAVVEGHGGEVRTLTAAGEHVTAYLHAKVILVKTKTRAICLTGSANCSIVALWASHPESNIEIGNLAVGDRDAFDHLFGPAMVTVGEPVDPSALDLRIIDDHEVPEAGGSVLRLQDVRWKAPLLTARVAPPVEDEASISVEVSGLPVPSEISLGTAEGGWTPLVARLTEPGDVAAVDAVAVVRIRIGDSVVGSAVPYQVERLQEQDRRRVDAERLRHAAQLELEDPDLEQALAALEEILVTDNVARWGRESKPKVEGPDGPTIAWEDIDWGAVRRHPRFVAYGNLQGLGAPGSALAGYLEGLSQVIRGMLDPAVADGGDDGGSSGGDDEDESEPDVIAGVEGGVDVDAGDDIVLEEPGRRQSPAARNRRLIRNFVRRNLAALEQPEFREGAGPGIVIPNAIILNWVCWWVATKDDDFGGAELIDERLRLWELLWGDGVGDGYLAELDDEHRLLVLDRFDEQHFEGVLVASIVDVWRWIPEVNTSDYRRLRAFLRRAVCHPCWQVAAEHMVEAAVFTSSRPTTVDVLDAADLAEVLWSAACEAHADADVQTAIASAIGLGPTSVTMSSEIVSVDGTDSSRSVRQASIGATLDVAEATKALASWLGAEDRTHYRLTWDGGVALYRSEEGTGWVVHDEGDEIDLMNLEPLYPPWRIVLDLLYRQAEAEAEAAA